MKISKHYDLIIFSIISYLVFNFYNVPLGLMDDFKNVLLVEDLNKNAINTFVEWNKVRIFSRGMIQPFYLLQVYIQYFSYSYLGSISVYVINSILIFLIFKNFIEALNLLKINVSFWSSFLIFFIYPFTYDLFLLPSLQEKFIFLFFAIAVKILLNNRFKNPYSLFFIGLVTPLVKLQGSIFFFPYLFFYLFFKNKKSKYLFLGILLGVVLQGYVIFFIDGDYFIFESSINKLLNNILNIYNLFFILIIFTLLFLVKPFNRKRIEDVSIFGLCIGGLSLIFIYSNWYIAGYLVASYAFFISIFLSLLLSRIIKYKNLKNILVSFSLLIIIIMFFSPRIERWSDLNDLYVEINLNKYGDIYSCSSESTKWLNELQEVNNFITAKNLYEVKPTNFYLLYDDYQCSDFIEFNKNNCSISTEKSMRYERIKILKIEC